MTAEDTARMKRLRLLATSSTVGGDLAWLLQRHDGTVAALKKLYDWLPQIDNGRCALCRQGYRKYTTVTRPMKAGLCSNVDCISHVVEKALA